MKRLIFALMCCLSSASANAVVGDARRMANTGGPIVMIVGARGNDGILCTGTALARDLVLTAAHCVAPGTRLQIMPSVGSRMILVGTVAQHPRYDAHSYARGRVTADVALIKLASSLPDYISPAGLAAEGETVAPGDRLLIAGFGMTVAGKNASTGIAHMATLLVTGLPGNLQIRLVDPRTRGERFGLGACTGDSGGPAFREIDGHLRVLGVISWSTGPADSEGCGGMTGVTPLTLYLPWIATQAAKMGTILTR